MNSVKISTYSANGSHIKDPNDLTNKTYWAIPILYTYWSSTKKKRIKTLKLGTVQIFSGQWYHGILDYCLHALFWRIILSWACYRLLELWLLYLMEYQYQIVLNFSLLNSYSPLTARGNLSSKRFFFHSHEICMNHRHRKTRLHESTEFVYHSRSQHILCKGNLKWVKSRLAWLFKQYAHSIGFL